MRQPAARAATAREPWPKRPPRLYAVDVVGTQQAINLSLLEPPYDFVRDYAPVALVASAPLALVIHASLPAKSVREFIALAKAHPGELNYFSSGTGTGTHLAAVIFDQLAGVRTTHVPYKGGAQGLGDLLSGQVQFAVHDAWAARGRPCVCVCSASVGQRYTSCPNSNDARKAASKVRSRAMVWLSGPGRHTGAIVNSWRPNTGDVANPDVRERFKPGIEPV